MAVQVSDGGRRLVRISADGQTVDAIVDGEYHRPAYSLDRGLLAVIATDGKDGPADAGKLCVLDPLDTATHACAPRSRPADRQARVGAERPLGARPRRRQGRPLQRAAQL